MGYYISTMRCAIKVDAAVGTSQLTCDRCGRAPPDSPQGGQFRTEVRGIEPFIGTVALEQIGKVLRTCDIVCPV